MEEVPPSLDELLKRLMEVEGSDLHLKVGSPPAFRIDGVLHRANLPSLTARDTERFLEEILPGRLREAFDETGEADFAHGVPALGRFRVNCYRQRGSVNVVIRAVRPASQGFVELGLPAVVERLAAEPRGIVLVTGPTGSGKTTTIGAMIDHINATRRVNIITLEDPIEILHPDKLAIVSQREVGVDTHSFREGLRRILRQDPDVIFIGEMRDRETVEAALQAGETGHLVLSTLHTVDATETINRVIDFYPPYLERQVRTVLATTLRGIVSLRLLPRADGKGRIPAVEVLVNTERVFERIVDPEQTHTIHEVIAEGAYYGMQTFDQALLKLYADGLVTFQDALAFASEPTSFKLAVQNRGLLSA